MPKHFFVNDTTSERFQILGFDKATGLIKLKGRLATIDEPYDKEKTERMGYKLVTEPDEPVKVEEDE